MSKKYDAIKFTSLKTEKIRNDLFSFGILFLVGGLLVDTFGTITYHNTKEKENQSVEELAAFFKKEAKA